jgi:hypothetical protein
MRILITGKGTSGSFQIRGFQLGQAIGAEVQPMAEPSDCRSAQIVVGVKRIPEPLLRAIKASGRKFVWDVVDAWPQPCDWSEAQAKAWLYAELRRLQPDAVVFGTPQMLKDSGFTGPTIVLPHHAWPKYAPNPVRPVRVVGYEGAEQYLGRWRSVVERECDRRGWAFRINGDMAGADIGIALRDGGGYPATWWKPGTKLANLQALGIPALCSEEAGYRDISNGTEYWIQSKEHIGEAFDALESAEMRHAISKTQQESTLRLDQVAADYKAWLKTLL